MFTFDPYSPAIDADPFPAYKTLRDEYPCFWSAEANMWVLSRYADISTALSDWRTYSSASGNLMDELPNRAGSTLGTTDPPRHDRLRGLIQHAFTRRNLESLGEPIRELGKEQIAQLRDQKEFDFVDVFSSKVTTKILFTLLGLPPGNDQEVRDKAVLMVQSDPVTRKKGQQHIDAYNWMTDYAGTVLAERKRNPGNDLMSLLVQAEVDGERLLDREVLLTSTTLIMAGIESLGVSVYHDLREGISGADVITMLRLQRERMRSALLPRKPIWPISNLSKLSRSLSAKACISRLTKGWQRIEP